MFRLADYLWLWVLLALHGALGAGIVLGLPSRSDPAIGLMIGGVAGQAALLAVITAWFPWPIAVRLPIALAGLALSWFTVVGALWRAEPPGPIGHVALILGGMIGGQYVMTTALFWIARLAGSWRLGDAAAAPLEMGAQACADPPGLPFPPPAPELDKLAPAAQPPSQPQPLPQASDSQFRLVHLLFWTGLVAVVLAVGRILLPADAWGEERMPADIALTFILITAFNALIAIPLTLVLLLPRLEHALAMGALVLVIWCPLMLVGQVWGYALIRSFDTVALFAILDGAQAVVLGVSLLLVRAHGLRLTHENA